MPLTRTVRLTWVHPDDPQDFTPEYAREHAEEVLCFDLDEYGHDEEGFEGALRHIGGLHALLAEDPRAVIPCVVVLKSAITPPLTYQQADALSGVGAILCEKTQEDTRDSLSELEAQIAGILEVEVFEHADAERPRPGDGQLDDDFEIFAAPPFQLDEDSFARLLERARTPDGSREKDD